MQMAIRFLLRAFALVAIATLSAEAGAQEIVLVPNRVIYPGETIDQAALKEVTLRAGRIVPTGAAVHVAELDGKVTKRTLLPGRYIPAAALRQAWVVEQGAAVLMTFIAGGLTISATGVTLQPGAAGDIVRVRNIDSGKILSGVVMADGSIRVGAS
ncbi:MAG: flagellar basal body P-ring formation protein FlgA [Rhizobiaceae bacterium]|nr:flagellar basal body P-ring formation protein FlgA [Rhizobiaceae bacterium]